MHLEKISTIYEHKLASLIITDLLGYFLTHMTEINGTRSEEYVIWWERTVSSVCVCVCQWRDKTFFIWQKDGFHLWSRVCLMTTWKTSHIDTRSLWELILFSALESMCVETWRTQDQSFSAVSAAHVIRQSVAMGRHQHSTESVQKEWDREWREDGYIVVRTWLFTGHSTDAMNIVKTLVDL